jgi:MFS family permease
LKLVAVLWLVQVTSVAFPVYGASVINTYMIADLGLSRGALGTISGLFLWLSGFPAPLVALLMQKKGIRRTMLLGATGLTIGTTLLATVVSSGLQYGLIFCSVVAFGTISCGPIAAQTTVARWSGRHRGRAIAFLLTGPTVGGFIAPLLLNAVIDG